MDYIEIINELNSALYDKKGETEYNFNYSTDGFMDIINFGNLTIWNSEMDDREWIEDKNDYEPLIPFIKKIFNKEVDKLVSLKFDLHN